MSKTDSIDVPRGKRARRQKFYQQQRQARSDIRAWLRLSAWAARYVRLE